jgi:flagellar secretion chaperone FliS
VLTQNLGDLYVYMTRRLVHANLNSDFAAVGELLGLLGEIRAAGAPIGSQVRPGVAVSAPGSRRG